MKAHLIDTYPGTKVKVISKGQGQISGQISGSCFSKDGCFRGISVSQTHLVYLLFILYQAPHRRLALACCALVLRVLNVTRKQSSYSLVFFLSEFLPIFALVKELEEVFRKTTRSTRNPGMHRRKGTK